MNRLIALKQNKNDSLQSNVSAHDGYETAMDDTASSTSVSMYFSMNESGMSLDKTIEAADANNQPQLQCLNLDNSISIPESEQPCNVLQPIVSSNCLSPVSLPRKSLTSTPLSKLSAAIADEDSSSPKQHSFVTVRKIGLGDGSSANRNAEDTENMSVCEQTEDETPESARTIGEPVQDVSAATAATSAQSTDELSGVDLMDVSETPVTEIAPATIAAAPLLALATGTSVAQTDDDEERISLMSALSKPVSYNFHKRRIVIQGSMASIVEAGSESTTPAERHISDVAADAVVPSRRLTRRSFAAAASAALAAVRASPAARQRGRPSLASITPRKTIGQRRSMAGQVAALARTPRTAAGIARTAAAAATNAGNRRRSMATTMTAAAAAIGANPLRAASLRTRQSLAASTSAATLNAADDAAAPALAVRRRKSVLPGGDSAPPPAAKVVATVAAARVNSMRRSIAPTARAVTPRKVIASTASAVLALNPTRRRVSIRPTTPTRRRSTLAAPKTRATPRRVKTPTQLLGLPAQPLHLNAMPAPPAAAASSNYFACSHCDRTFLQQSRLNTHLRSHGSAAPAVHVCQHCDRAFDKPIALSNHLLEHCAKIGVGERRRLLQKRDIVDREAATGGSASSRSSSAALVPAKRRANTNTGAHRGVYHTPNKPIKCNECSKQFADPVSFALHVPTHRVA